MHAPQGVVLSSGEQFYSEQFPAPVLGAQHPMARLELLNIVMAL